MVIGRAQVEPLGEKGDGSVGELGLLVRHVRFGFMTDQFQKPAARRVEGLDGRTVRTLPEQTLAGTDIELAFDLLPAVTFQTVFQSEQGLNLLNL